MKYYFKLLIFPILMVSCTDNLSQEDKVDSLSIIASNQLYHVYGAAITKNLNDIREGLFDQDEIMQYVNANYEDVPDLCEVDFSQSTIRGINIYMNNLCDVNQSLETLRQNLPAYARLSRAEKVRVHEIYAAEFRNSSNIYFHLNN